MKTITDTEHTEGKLYHSFPNRSNKKIAIWSQQEYGIVLIATLDNTTRQAKANAERMVNAWNEYENLKDEIERLKDEIFQLTDHA